MRISKLLALVFPTLTDEDLHLFDDFVKLAAAREIHAGIVLVERGGLLRDEPIALVREVAAALAVHSATINELLRVAADGSMTFEASPS